MCHTTQRPKRTTPAAAATKPTSFREAGLLCTSKGHKCVQFGEVHLPCDARRGHALDVPRTTLLSIVPRCRLLERSIVLAFLRKVLALISIDLPRISPPRPLRARLRASLLRLRGGSLRRATRSCTMVPNVLAEIFLRARISGLFECHVHTLTSQREAQSFGDLGVHCRSHILVEDAISMRRSGRGTNAQNHQMSVPPEVKTRFRGEVLVVCLKNGRVNAQERWLEAQHMPICWPCCSRRVLQR